ADQPATALAPFDVVVDGRQELVGVAIDADDTRYVSDRGAGRVYRLTPSGALTTVAANLDRPAGIAVTVDGRLLIVEEHAGRILRLEPNGSLTVVTGGLKMPRWLVVHGEDTLYVTAQRSALRDGADRAVIIRVDLT